jgi:hypothetical protein
MRIIRTRRRAAWWTGLLVLSAVLVTNLGICADTSDSTDPLLDLFIKKGYVTQEEAEKVKAEADFNRTNGLAYPPSALSKWKISNGTKSVELFGDIRVRYEDRSVADPKDNSIDLQRLRYAVRIGLRGDMMDDFYYGLRLETAANPRSPWVTAGTSANESPYQGPFGKSTAGINVGQAYIGWKPGGWLNITLGVMPNPLYTTPMVWDNDLNPEGAAENFKYTVGEADLFATFGQFVYADFNPNSAAKGLGVNGLIGQHTDNIFMFTWQGGFNYHITTNTSAKIAATLYQYSGLQRSTPNSEGGLAPYFGDPYVGEGAYYYAGGSSLSYAPGYGGYSPGTVYNLSQGGYGSVSYPFNQVGLNDLLVVEIPFEFNFKIDKLAARVFGDYAYNLEGSQRATEAAAAYSTILSQTVGSIPHSFPAQTHDVHAYQIGFGVGSSDVVEGPMQGLVYGTSSQKHAWEFRTYWQHIEQYSLDPNLIDSDFFEGRENLEGIYTAFAYGFTDNVIGTIRYGHASRINDKLGTGGSNQDIPQMNPINSYNLFQVDMTVRF